MTNIIIEKENLKNCIDFNGSYRHYLENYKSKKTQKSSEYRVETKVEAYSKLLSLDLKEFLNIETSDEEWFESDIFKNVEQIEIISFSEEEKQINDNKYTKYKKVNESRNGFGQYVSKYVHKDSSTSIMAQIKKNKYLLEIDKDKIVTLNIIDLYELLYDVSYNEAFSELCMIHNIRINEISRKIEICKNNLEYLKNEDLIERIYPKLWKLLLKNHNAKLQAFFTIYMKKIGGASKRGVFISGEEIAQESNNNRTTIQPVVKAFLALGLFSIDHIEKDNRSNQVYFYYDVNEYTDEYLKNIEKTAQVVLDKIYTNNKLSSGAKKINICKLTKETCQAIFSEEVAERIFN